MKNLISLVLALLLLVPIYSCEGKSCPPNDTPPGSNSDPGGSDSVPIGLDSALQKQMILMLKNQKSQIDSIVDTNDALKDSIQELSLKINTFEERSNLWNIGVIVALILSLVALAFIFFVRRSNIDKKSLVKMQSVDFPNLRHEVDQLKSQHRGGRVPSKKENDELGALKNKVSDLESQLNGLYNQNRSNGSISSIVGETSKNGYKKSQENSSMLVSKSYYVDGNGVYQNQFIKAKDTKQEDSIIRIDEVSVGKGEFDIISIEQIRQLNGLDAVIKHAPLEISLREAKTYKTIKKGNCNKANDGTWKVNNPVIIQIFK